MKYFILNFILLFTFTQSFGQDLKQYKFNYYSLYNLKNEKSEVVLKRYIIGNSNDASYFMYINVTPTDSTNAVSLYDTKNSRQYEFKIERKPLSSIASFADLTTTYQIYKYDFSRKIDTERVFDIQNERIENKEIITSKVYKNKRRKKLISNVQYSMIESDIVKNQFYITDIVFAHAFPMREIKTNGVMEKQVSFDTKSGAVKATRELIEINPLELNINLKTEPVITRSSLIIQYK